MLLGATPAVSQSPADLRAVVVAVSKEVLLYEHVRSIRLDDTAHTRVVARTLGAQVMTDGTLRVTQRYTGGRPEASAWLMRTQIRGDSAFVHVMINTTVMGRPFASGYMLTVVRHARVWAVSNWELTGIS